MDIKPTIRLEEVPKTIILPNPGGRELVITPEESGMKEEQVFTSEDLPHEIPYELLGLVKFPDGSIYPKYRANVTTTKKLALKGKKGVNEGIDIINKVAWWLTYQEEIMLSAQSIKRSDLKKFEYKNEKLKYWLASPGVRICASSGCGFAPGAVFSGGARTGYALFVSVGGSYEGWLGVRPTMVLKSKVQLEPPEISWVEL